jgi:hypothetical protein
MNTTTRIAAAVIALFAATGSFAVEGTQEFTDAKALSMQSRAAVVAQIDRAAPQYVGDAAAAPTAVSTLERARVLAEAREAQRLGLTGPSETLPQPTAAQIEQIRIAGERAVAQTVAATR